MKRAGGLYEPILARNRSAIKINQCFTNTVAPYGVLGLAGLKNQESLGFHEPIEGVLSSKILGSPLAQDDAAWLAKSPALREKLIAVG